MIPVLCQRVPAVTSSILCIHPHIAVQDSLQLTHKNNAVQLQVMRGSQIPMTLPAPSTTDVIRDAARASSSASGSVIRRPSYMAQVVAMGT